MLKIKKIFTFYLIFFIVKLDKADPISINGFNYESLGNGNNKKTNRIINY